ncbi:hypothetical protein KR026_002329 [Drosophila bipectinata]|nr:hypothetical protein KR026_002329 [Drosophila bipectinata]
MHRTEKQSDPSLRRRLCLEFHREDFGTNLQMSRKKCNNQQRRGRRRRECAGNSWGLFGSISLTILMLAICMAHTSNAVPTIESSSSSSSNIGASSTTVTVAVTPSSSNGSSTTESPTEQQQPQGQCLLEGVWVPETTVRCEKQANCRAIQRTGHCCPDYKCDCEKDGKTYANGYKLVDPDTPCTVCYCKGGDIVCSSVTCFRRDDCMPKYVPGRCCPEYDNCPILDNNPPLASEPPVSITTISSTAKPVAAAQPAGFNWNITIKEITKPTEIRITDDNKAKPAIPTRKTSSLATTEGPGLPATLISLGDSSAAATVGGSSATSTTSAPSTEPTTATAAPVAASSSAATVATTTDTAATPTVSQDSNQKALPVTNSSSSSESLKLIASVGYIERPLAQSSNVVEQQVRPLVTYTSDGLQPLAENDPSKVNIKREYTTEGALASSTQKKDDDLEPLSTGNVFLQNGFKESLVESSDADLEPDTAGSDNVYHIISTTEGPASLNKISTDAPATNVSPAESTSANPSFKDISTEGPGTASSEVPPSSSPHHLDVEDDVPQVESNPAYPSLPEDDFSLRDVNFPLVELEDVGEVEKDEPRSIVSPFDMDNHHVKLAPDANLDGSGSGSGGGSGGGDIELFQEKASTTERIVADASVVREKSSLIPLLMNSGEDISGEMPRIQNSSFLQLEKISRGEETELGSGEIREPITPRTLPVSGLEIDELGSGAGQVGGVDPKADAESLKLDESQESTASKASGSVDKSSARAEKSFVERALPLGRLYLQRIY